MDLTAKWSGVPVLYHGVPSSAVIWTAEQSRSLLFVRMVWIGSVQEGGLRTEVMFR